MPISTLFPYTTLFRSNVIGVVAAIALLWSIIDGVLFRVARSEEHTSELQSLRHLVCRLLLKKKNVIIKNGLRAPGQVIIGCDSHTPIYALLSVCVTVE